MYKPDQLTARIKHINFINALRGHGVPVEQMPVTRPLCGELIVSYVFDMPDQFVMATPPLLAKAGVDPRNLDQLVHANFKGNISVQLTKNADRKGMMAVRTGQDLEAVVLLFDGFWNGHVTNYVQGEIVVCAPRRNVLLIADTAVPGAIDALQEDAAKAFHQSQDPHALSLQMMKWRGKGWELFGQQKNGAQA